MILDQRYADCWADYLQQTGPAALTEMEVFKRRLYRQRRTILYPPPIFARSCVDEMATLSIELLRILSTLPDRIFSGDCRAWMAFLGITGDEADFLAHFCQPRLMQRATQFARPDLLPTDTGFKATEINVSTPMGGMATCEPFLAEFALTDFCRYLNSRGVHMEMPNTSRLWLEALLAHCPVARAISAPILFEALANPADIDAGRQAFVHMAKQGGFAVVSGLITQLNIGSDGVYLDGQRIHTVFTMFTWAELCRHVPFDLVKALVRAEERGWIDFIASPASALFDHKVNFEILTSDSFSRFFTDSELTLLRQTLPRTFRLTAARRREAIDDRVNLVLKPAAEYGGKGIVFGAQTAAADWEAALSDALGSGRVYICQEKISGFWRRDVPMPNEKRRYLACLGPMIFGGKYAGLFVRQSLDKGRVPVINVSHGAEEGSGVVCQAMA